MIFIFMVVLKDSLSSQRSTNKSEQRTELLLSIFNFLKNGGISNESDEFDIGILNKKALENKLNSLTEILERQGTTISIEIVSFDQKILLQSNNLNKKPAQSLSLPIIFEQGSDRIPAKIIIWLQSD